MDAADSVRPPEGALTELPGLLGRPNRRVAHHIDRDEWIYDGGPLYSKTINDWARDAALAAGTPLKVRKMFIEWAATDRAFYVLSPVSRRRFPWSETAFVVRRKRSSLGMKGALVTVITTDNVNAVDPFWVGKSAARNVAAIAAHHSELRSAGPLF